MDALVPALGARLRRNPGAPLVTYLDQVRGERTELSTASLANAAAKVANALRDEYALDPGAVVALVLPLHWQLAAWLAGAWTAGVVVTIDPDAPCDLTVTTADRAAELDREAAVVSLHPFGLPITEPLPPRAHDVTLAVRQQPDAYLFDTPGPNAPALMASGIATTSAQVWQDARDLAARWGLLPGGRLLASGPVGVEAVLAALAVPLAADASVVLAAQVTDEAALIDSERVTATAALPR